MISTGPSTATWEEDRPFQKMDYKLKDGSVFKI